MANFASPRAARPLTWTVRRAIVFVDGLAPHGDDESGLHEDIWKWLEQLAPFRADYAHHRTGEDNGDAHLKSMLVHHEVIAPITKGRLDLGTWQRVFYTEFDGQRDKRLIVKAMGE